MKQLWQRFQSTRAWQSWTRFGEARGNLLAAGVAFYGFFSIFPAVGIAAVVFGFVLRGRPDLIATVGDTVNSTLPGVIKNADNPDGLVALTAPDISFLTISGVVAVVSLLIAGTGWIGALRDGIRTVFGVEGSPGNVVTVKLRDLGVLATLGVAVLVSVVLTAATGALTGVFTDAVGSGASAVLVSVIGFFIGLVVDGTIMVVLLRVLTGVPLPWKDIRQGAMVGAVGQGIVKVFGVQLIANATKNPLYGSLILVIGLLFWFNLIAKLILLGASWAANDIEGTLARLEAESVEQAKEGTDDAPRESAARPAPAATVRHGVRTTPAQRAAARAREADLESARGRAVAGLPTFGERQSDRTSLAAGAVLGATVAVVVGSAGRAVRALVRRR